MSEYSSDNLVGPHEFKEQAELAIYDELAHRARSGTFYPARKNSPAEYVGILPELGWAATFSTNADQVDSPQIIHVERCRPEVGRFVELWITPSGIETQHGSWDDESNPHTIDDRGPIHPEELLELYGLLVTSRNFINSPI